MFFLFIPSLFLLHSFKCRRLKRCRRWPISTLSILETGYSAASDVNINYRTDVFFFPPFPKSNGGQMLFLVYAPISKRASRMQRAFLASFHPTKNQKERNNNKKKRQEIDKIVGEKQQAKLMRRHGRLKLPSQPLRNKKKRE